jgi:serine/threonine protein kinase
MSDQEHDLIFDLLRSIGHGGQADVFLVRLRKTGGFYAGKFLREAWDPLARDAFKREAMRQDRIAGEHVVPIVAWNLDAEKPFIILEYMPHGSLADEILRRERLGPVEALTITRQIAVALADMHGRGVIHRDLKPGNVLRSPDGRLKLNDLGYAATLTLAEFVRAPGFVGTPAYAAPEQMLGVASAKSDVYALGVILYELMMGVPLPRTTPLSQVHGAAASHLDLLVAQFSAEDAHWRPTAAEAVSLIDDALRKVHAANPPKLILPPLRSTEPAPTRPANSGSGWGWLFGAAAAVGAIALLSGGGGSTWDSSVGRYRGTDGRFKSG